MIIMDELIKYYPRQLAYPERTLCANRKLFIAKANSLNGVKQKLYFSLYNCDDKGQFTNPLIDKISFDKSFWETFEKERIRRYST